MPENLAQLILLLVTDQFRQDAFHPFVTPNLYKLSLDPAATTFTNAYSSTPTCTPARAGLFTGKSPWNHGMLGYAHTVNCQEYPATLPAMLHELGGYETFIVGKNHFGWNAMGDDVTHGFQHLKLYEPMPKARPDDYEIYYNSLHPGKDPLNGTCHSLGINDWIACPYGSPREEEHPTAWTTRQALSYLQKYNFSDPEQRMFLKVSYHRPHSPYDPPGRLLQKYLHSENVVPQRHINQTSWDTNFRNHTPMTASDWHGDPGKHAAHHTRAGYLASVDFVDEGIGAILDWLSQRETNADTEEGASSNLLESSLIIWASDHGDMNGDHNLWRKGYPYEGSAHINLIAKLPRSTGEYSNIIDNQPKKSSALVELRDVTVTIYDYLGILRQVERKDPLLNGISVLPILRGENNENENKLLRQWLDLEHSTVYNDYIHWNALVGIHKHNGSPLLWKYIFYSLNGAEQLFCLSSDPNEMNELSTDTQWSHMIGHWRETMVKQFEREGRGTDWVRNGRLVPRTKPTIFGPNYPCGNKPLLQE